MSTNERPPLWREMLTVFDQSFDYRDGIAKQLRAVADEAEQHFIKHGGTWSDVVEWLRCQAQIAEAGE